MKLRNKILFPVLGILVAVVAVISIVNYMIASKAVTEIIDLEINDAIESINMAEELSAEITDVVLSEIDKKNIALSKALAEIVRVNPDSLDTAEMTRLANILKVTEVHVTDEDGVLWWGSIPDYYGLDFSSLDQTAPFMKIIEDPTHELAQEAQPNAALGIPVSYTGVSRTDQKGIVQVGVAAEIIDELTAAFDIQKTLDRTNVGNAGFCFIVENNVITAHPDTTKIGQSFTDNVKKTVSDSRQWLVLDDGKEYYAGFKTTDAETIYAVLPRNEFYSQLKTLETMSWIISVFSVLLMGVVLVTLLIKVMKPLNTLSSFMENAANTGNLKLNTHAATDINEISNLNDEIGDTIRNCLGFFKHVATMSDELESVAKGDLRTKVDVLGGEDTMGNSLKNMVGSLNTMFGDINQTSVCVSDGSKQIAQSAQLLSEGSTEQTSEIENLSASISAIVSQTKDNAEMAEKAVNLAEKIKGSAEKGNKQMDDMTAAVKDINQASQSIGKVIKIIDDIAFQTNILALNAAVEAARAGQHGKGFAVVADEVRNLASKSADAAKDTGNLIAGSIEKAELGLRITNETASNFAEIVSEINESAQIIAQISNSSETQASDIEQLNKGIEQVALVIQQNSATAEQEAAASEEMSGQAVLLQKSISQFKLAQ